MLYFAYGSCMSPEDLRFTVDAKFISAGRLEDHRIAFTRYASFRKGGVADVVESKGDYLEGVLLEVKSFSGLDAREGHPWVYYRNQVPVLNYLTGETVTAHTYKVLEPLTVEVKPSEEYERLMMSSAKRFLSPEYSSLLEEKLSKFY